MENNTQLTKYGSPENRATIKKPCNVAKLSLASSQDSIYSLKKESLVRASNPCADVEAQSHKNATQGEQNTKKRLGFKAWIKNHIPTKRRIIQFYSALLFNANLKGFSTGYIYKGNAKNLCTPGLNCYSCPGATTACPLGSLQNAMTSSDKSTIYYIFGIILLYAILAGRWICGWLCPFGLIQELLHKIKTPKLKKSIFTRILSYLKYVILIFFVFVIPLIYSLRNVPLPAFCKYICPAGTFEGAIGLLANEVNDSSFRMLGPLFTWKFALMVSFIVASIFVFRFFCRFFCPLGALYGLFNKISIFGIKYDKSACTQCGLCVSKCKMDIHHVGDHECISCGDCIDTCPTKAISFKGSKIILKDNEIDDLANESAIESAEAPASSDTATSKPAKKRDLKKAQRVTKIVFWSALLAILLGVLVYFNFIHKNPETPSGNSVGDACPSSELAIVDENGISEEYVDPTAYTGKVTVINFWGTWCTPCVQELPHFDAIAAKYKNTANIYAVHSTLAKNTAADYIEQYYKDSNMIFLMDTKQDPSDRTSPDAYFAALGGTDSWPMTLVLDRNGIIVAHFTGSISYDELENAVLTAMNS